MIPRMSARAALPHARLSALRSFSSPSGRSLASTLNAPLVETDPELANLIELEKARQRSSINLIASENFTSQSVFDALGSVMSNKYSEVRE